MKFNISFLSSFIFLVAINIYGADDASLTKVVCDPCTPSCDSEVLRIKDICAHNISVKCLKACRINNAKDIVTESLCSKYIAGKFIAADNLGVNNDACFKNIGVSNNLCVTGTIVQSEICQDYRATAQLFANIPYTLGDPIPYDNVQDDPNGNTSLAPFAYTVPVSGYYIVSIQIDQRDLVTAGSILGNPTGYLDVLVNGNKFHTSSYPYLTFSNEQRAVLTSLYRLNAGDKVQADYRIAVIDEVVGLKNLVGTVTLEGGPFNSSFSVHYLSSTTCSTPCNAPCVPSTFDTTCPTPCSGSCE